MHSLNETCPCCDPVRWRADGINTHESGLSQNHNAAGMFPILLGSPRSLPGPRRLLLGAPWSGLHIPTSRIRVAGARCRDLPCDSPIRVRQCRADPGVPSRNLLLECLLLMQDLDFKCSFMSKSSRLLGSFLLSVIVMLFSSVIH